MIANSGKVHFDASVDVETTGKVWLRPMFTTGGINDESLDQMISVKELSAKVLEQFFDKAEAFARSKMAEWDQNQVSEEKSEE